MPHYRHGLAANGAQRDGTRDRANGGVGLRGSWHLATGALAAWLLHAAAL